MAGYLGSKQLFRNRLGKSAVREIYLGSKQVMGFTPADYVTSEWIGEKAHAGDVPIITTNAGTSATVSTNNYNPGHAYTKYFCDHIKVMMQYSGGIVVYDCDGNVVVDIVGTISFNYLNAKWTIGSKCIINGTTVFDTEYSNRDISTGRLTYEVFYDLNTKKWTVIWNGGTYTGGVEEWRPTYMRVSPQLWFISSTAGVDFFNGYLFVSDMNRARGYPNAR